MIRSMNMSDIEQVVQTHLRTFPFFFLSLMGKQFLRLYYSSICLDSDGMAFVCLNDSGMIIGFVVGTTNPRDFYYRLFKKKWYKFACASIAAIIKKPSIMLRIICAATYHRSNPIGSDIAGLHSIGISPETQQQGLGRELISVFLEHARKHKCQKVFLTTDRDNNEAVNRFYIKNGFVIEREFVTQQGRWMNEYWITL